MQANTPAAASLCEIAPLWMQCKRIYHGMACSIAYAAAAARLRIAAGPGIDAGKSKVALEIGALFL
jgi:hypothetical protein